MMKSVKVHVKPDNDIPLQHLTNMQELLHAVICKKVQLPDEIYEHGLSEQCARLCIDVLYILVELNMTEHFAAVVKWIYAAENNGKEIRFLSDILENIDEISNHVKLNRRDHLRFLNSTKSEYDIMEKNYKWSMDLQAMGDILVPLLRRDIMEENTKSFIDFQMDDILISLQGKCIF